MTRHGRLGLAALALLASLTFVPSAFAGSLVNQIVQKSGTTVTWTGGSQNSGANPDDDAITVTESGPGEVTIVSTSGPITLFPDGPTGDTTTGCTQPNANTAVCGTDVAAFTANARDGNDTVEASGLTSIPATLNADQVDGDSGSDTMTGGAADDGIYGLAGNDTLTGNGGADYIDAGVGADTLAGGTGNDSIYGGDGADTITGGDGLDYIRGGNEADSIDGGDGTDAVYGDDGNDIINGGPGDDEQVITCSGVSCCAGPCASDTFYGGLFGGDGDDTIHGNDGADLIDGGASHSADGDLGTDGDDNLSGDDGPDEMYGGTGDDTMAGNGGTDRVYGEDGDDQLSGGDDTDYVDGGDGDDVVNGDAGDDAGHSCCFSVDGGLQGGDGNDTINGGDGTDYADGGANNDVVNGDAGDDTNVDTCVAAGSIGGQSCIIVYGDLYGGSGNDQINGGDGRDSAHGQQGADTINGGAGNDGDRNNCFGCGAFELGGGPGKDTINGGEGNDYIKGGPDEDTLNGDAGDDFIAGSCDGGCDSNEGGLDDTLNGGDGTDTLLGEDGADTVNGDAGDDRVFEYDDEGADVVTGGGGIDDLTYASCCNPVSITLDGVANDGETAPADTKDPGDPGNNYDVNNVHYLDTGCDNCSVGFNETPVTLVGNAGANLLFGSSGDDDLTGGAGADYLNGGEGADTFHTRDGYPDYVDCEGGVDTALVDQFDRVHNCENVEVENVPSAFDTAKPPVPPVPPAGPASTPDITPPVLTIDVPKTTFTADQLVAGVKVSFSCNEDCSLNLRLLAQQSSGSATFSRVKGYNVVVGRRTLGFGTSKRDVKVRPCERKQGGPQSKACLKRFKKSLNARLAKTGKVTMKLFAVTEDRAGNRTQRTKTITIRGKKRR